MKRITETTTTHLVCEALKAANDFRTVSQLMAETKQTNGRVHAALHHLRNYKAAECVQSDGQLWWYATPENDTRQYTREEHTPESKPRKQRKSPPRAKFRACSNINCAASVRVGAKVCSQCGEML